jgi:hypothetical protein
MDDMKITDAQERKDVLKFLKFGLLPAGSPALSKDAPNPAARLVTALYATSSAQCDELRARRHDPAGVVRTLEAGSPSQVQLGRLLAGLPSAEQVAAASVA